MLTILAVVIGTFASEDLTCIATGLLIQRGQMGVGAGILACTSGIFAGDVGLWALGRVFGRTALVWPWAARRLQTQRIDELREWLLRHAAGAIVASRFMPGTRFALYVMSGVLRLPAVVFMLWALIGALLWTPTIVLLTATLGDTFVTRIAPIVGAGWTSRAAVALVMLGVLQLARVVASEPRRIRLGRAPRAVAALGILADVAVLRAGRPLGCGSLAMASRYRHDHGRESWNAGRRDSGRVEVRHPAEPAVGCDHPLGADCIRFARRNGPPRSGCRGSARRDAAAGFEARRWSARRRRQACPHLEEARAVPRIGAARGSRAAVSSRPFEAGVFYYRMPGERSGRIFSITDKRFPILVGDGESTVETLIWTHPDTAPGETPCADHNGALARVLATGERFPLAMAGNHCQGTMFCDGRHLITPALEKRIDEVARAYPGFFVGRFDIRYSNVEAFMAGRDLAVVELNGVTAESTNIYDPAGSLWNAYRLLFQQWAVIFAIGAANRAAGASVSPLRRLVGLVRAHSATQIAFSISD